MKNGMNNKSARKTLKIKRNKNDMNFNKYPPYEIFLIFNLEPCNP